MCYIHISLPLLCTLLAGCGGDENNDDDDRRHYHHQGHTINTTAVRIPVVK
jgi:hypothetical protein